MFRNRSKLLLALNTKFLNLIRFKNLVFKANKSMKTLAKNHVSSYRVVNVKTFKNILIGPGKLPGLLSNGPQMI